MKHLLICLIALGLQDAVFAQQELRTIELSSIEGITTAQADWPDMNKRAFEADPLASYIPADQHAFFYPSFREMMDFVDALKSGRQTLERLGFSVSRLEFYEQQMCVWLDGWSRFWGPKTIRGVALTGSDPYMADGTDSAVLFDAVIGKLVFNDTKSKQEKKLEEIGGARLTQGTVSQIAYRAVISPDRTVCSYLAQVDNVVIVTNSLSQLQKIVETAQKRQPSMRDTNEYRFFRSRYNVDDNEQTALVVLTDAAIERWLSPKWYIGQSRRRVAAQSMSKMQSAPSAVTSSIYGNLEFMTPIAELPIDTVSPDEQQQYERFRTVYQRQWQNILGPAAVCFLHESGQTYIDLTLRSAVHDTEYGKYLPSSPAALRPQKLPPCSPSIAQVIMTVDTQSPFLVEMNGLLSQKQTAAAPADAFGWLGGWITVYAQDSPFWNECSSLLNADHVLEFIRQNSSRAPIAFAAEVADPAMLDAFMVSLRSRTRDDSAPASQPLIYKGLVYDKIIWPFDPNDTQSITVYCAVLPGQLVLSPCESVVRDAIDQTLSSRRTKKVDWLGRDLSLRIAADGWKVIEPLLRQRYSASLETQAWSAVRTGGVSRPVNMPLFTFRQADLGLTAEEGGIRALIRIDREED